MLYDTWLQERSEIGRMLPVVLFPPVVDVAVVVVVFFSGTLWRSLGVCNCVLANGISTGCM